MRMNLNFMKEFNLLKSIVFVIVSIIPTFFGFLLAIMSSGAGHGDYLWAKVVFPVSMLSSIATSEITPFAIIIAALQFPVYAFVLSIAKSGKKTLYVGLAILGLHISAAVLCLMAQSSAF
jgi:hypothetical protein